MTKFYDRNGKSISSQQYSSLYADFDYKCLRQSRGLGKLVSTVWLGLDHSFGGGPPVIFETMVFPIGPDGEMIPSEIATDRYCTEEEALKGHEEMCLSYIRPLELIVRKLEEDDATMVDPD